MANVQFENLFKNYGDVKAVHDFNLKIDGEPKNICGFSQCHAISFRSNVESRISSAR